MNKLEFKILKKHFFNLIKLIKDNIETMEFRYGSILDNPINRALIFNTIKNHLYDQLVLGFIPEHVYKNAINIINKYDLINIFSGNYRKSQVNYELNMFLRKIGYNV